MDCEILDYSRLDNGNYLLTCKFGKWHIEKFVVPPSYVRGIEHKKLPVPGHCVKSDFSTYSFDNGYTPYLVCL